MDVLNEIAEPTTPALRLAHIAQAHPHLAETIAQHPNAYPELVSWAQDVRSAQEAQWTDLVVSDVSKSVASHRRGSTALARVCWSVVLVTVVTVDAVIPVWASLVEGGELWGFLWQAATVLHAVMLAAVLGGAAGAPTGGRRIAAIGFAVIATVAHLTGPYGSELGLPVNPYVPFPLLIGLALLGTISIFVAWMLSWPLHPLSLAVLPLLVAPSYFRSLWITHDYGMIRVAIVVETILLIVGLTLALVISHAKSPRAQPDAARSALAVDGGVSQQYAYGSAARTNTMAILSLVFAFFVSILAVVFGHVALGQIRRTGEPGGGMAVAGLVLGYIGIVGGAVAVIYWIVVVSTFANMSGYGY